MYMRQKKNYYWDYIRIPKNEWEKHSTIEE